MLRSLRALRASVVAALCLVALTGCVAAPRSYIVRDSDGFALKMAPGCDPVFTQVIVSYLSDAYGMPYASDR